MSDPAVQSYIDKWLEAHPAQRLSLPFLEPRQRELRLAWAALEQELVGATFGIREPAVAATKLNWWAEELTGAITSGGRHPLVKVLFGNDDARQLDASIWLAPALAALNELDAVTAADFHAQLEAAERFHAPLATLETRLWFGADADPTRATRTASLNHLLQRLARLKEHAGSGNLPLPMSRMARHGLDRAGLAEASDTRRRAVREQLDDLRNAWREARRLPGPLSLFRGLDDRMGMHWLNRALAARDPLVRLRHVQMHQTGFGTLYRAWVSARASRAADMQTRID